ncbi:hypothetical protein [Streptomyces luteogriseus]|uniref:hypothetical protein n=1 Tax=Streptomyces luteogriseus TaxID=68233 RepID=UPI00262AF2ED|nr:hypothetical protein [Streptomyces luteogriseus]WTJ27928.1 hypothetical protein OID52_13030 [Streptomyces luteogriseus]
MGTAGERRRTVWRLVLVVWALAVAVAGGLTLWMQDATEPRGPYVWERTDPGKAQDLPPCPTPKACAYAITP